MYLEAIMWGRTVVKGACKDRLNLKTEDKNDNKNGGKNNNFGGLTPIVKRQTIEPK
jgi:hypothetical protein